MFLSHGTRNHLTERLRRLFGGMPCRVQVAALPWRVTESGYEVMLVTSRDSGRWVLPKGWPEKREHPHEAAAREAGEEAGVSGAISPRELGCFYYGKKLASGMEWRCEVHVFPMEVDRVADKWPERKKRSRRWFAPDEAAALVREPDLGELIAGFGINPRQSAA
jgi:8-oxo-dGTP pyrophosphatase MutT (NUDIX family)